VRGATAAPPGWHNYPPTAPVPDTAGCVRRTRPVCCDGRGTSWTVMWPGAAVPERGACVWASVRGSMRSPVCRCVMAGRGGSGTAACVWAGHGGSGTTAYAPPGWQSDRPPVFAEPAMCSNLRGRIALYCECGPRAWLCAKQNEAVGAWGDCRTAWMAYPPAAPVPDTAGCVRRTRSVCCDGRGTSWTLMWPGAAVPERGACVWASVRGSMRSPVFGVQWPGAAVPERQPVFGPATAVPERQPMHRLDGRVTGRLCSQKKLCVAI